MSSTTDLTNLKESKRNIELNLELIKETFDYVKRVTKLENYRNGEVNLSIYNYIELIDIQLEETKNQLQPIMRILIEFNEITLTLLRQKKEYSNFKKRLFVQTQDNEESEEN
jgi:hypothetical protein